MLLRGEVDRVYLDAPDLLHLRHAGPAVELTKHNLRDVVLWNIGAEKASTSRHGRPLNPYSTLFLT